MYSNRYRLNASSSAPDTHTRKNKNARTKKNQSVRKGWSLYAAKKKRVCAADHTSIQIGIAWTPLQLLVPRSHATTKTSRSETRRVDAVKQKLDVRGKLHLYSNTHRLNAFSAVRDTYTRNKENGMSEKAGVRMREETSTYFRVVRRRRAQDCTRGWPAPYCRSRRLSEAICRSIV